MVDAALLGVAAAGVAFAGERDVDLEERVPICFFLQIKMWRMVLDILVRGRIFPLQNNICQFLAPKIV